LEAARQDIQSCQVERKKRQEYGHADGKQTQHQQHGQDDEDLPLDHENSLPCPAAAPGSVNETRKWRRKYRPMLASEYTMASINHHLGMGVTAMTMTPRWNTRSSSP